MDYFGEDTSHLQMRPSCCDNCSKGLSNWNLSDLYVGIDDQGQYDFTRDANTLITAIKCMEMSKFPTARRMVINLLIGNCNTSRMELPQFGVGKGRPPYYWGTLIDQLIYTDYIDFAAGKSELTLSKKGESWRNESASKTLKMKPVGAIYKFIERKPSTPFARIEPADRNYGYQQYRLEQSYRNIVDLFFGDCVHCG